MRRFERRRVERARRTVVIVGLSFTLGALADRALTWRLHELDSSERAAASDSNPVGHESPDHTPEPEPPDTFDDPPPVATSGAPGHEAAIAMLRARRLAIPVDGVQISDLRDSFREARGAGRTHEALDIMAPRHTPVRAVEDGTIARLFDSQGGGGITIYQHDPTRTFTYYYAHLERYAPGLHEGQAVRRGEVIGYVGSTGNASPDAPHLHFGIFRATPGQRWWSGEPINPYDIFAR